MAKIPESTVKQVVATARQTYNQTALAGRGFQMFLVETGRDDLPLFPAETAKVLEIK